MEVLRWLFENDPNLKSAEVLNAQDKVKQLLYITIL